MNLLVGTNNSGKTSILEAVQLLTSQGNLESLQDVMIGRGEYVLSDERGGGRELDIRHLFYCHEINIGSKFSIFEDSYDEKKAREKIIVSVERSEQLNLFDELRESVLIVQWLGLEDENIKLPLSSKEGLPIEPIWYLKIQ